VKKLLSASQSQINSEAANNKIESALKIYDIGDQNFNDKSWVRARSNYLEAIRRYLDAGISTDSDVVLNCYYNIAMTYWNEKDYKEARSYLELLRYNHPDYDRLAVKDLLAKLDRAGHLSSENTLE
jgi:outer membrane protein assembly factor BamD (BamD/ComL family)